MNIRQVGGDGAGGHRLRLIGFSLVDPAVCELSAVSSLEIPGQDGIAVVQGQLFFPTTRFEGSLGPEQTASIAVQTVSNCPAAFSGVSAIPVDHVLIHFDDGTHRTVAVELNGICGVRWDAFISWG